MFNLTGGGHMARRAGGKEILDKARELLSKAKTAEELRQAQAVYFPLEFGVTMEQTAKAIGVSKGRACCLRVRFTRSGGRCTVKKLPQGGRRREKSFHHRVFNSLNPLEDHLEESLRNLELDHERIHSIVSWPWTINTLLN